MFYGYRTAKYPVTAKVWNKLEAAERAAGVSNDQNTSGHALDVNANKQAKVKDFAATYGKEVMAENELRRALEMMETLARELAEKNRQIAEKDRQIERLLGLLESPPRPDDDSPEPPPPAGQRPGMVLRLRSAGQPRSGEPVPP